jgi:outer membrane protein insertion porin family
MRRIFALFLLALACISTLHAQYTIKNIVFKNQGPYSDAQLQAASGLKPGETLSVATLTASAQHLINTGAFEQLEPTLDGPFKAVTVNFKLQPVSDAKLLPVIFENFVWFTPEELDAELRKRVPLFIGRVPEAGNLADSIREALTQILSEKNIKAEVANIEMEPSASLPHASMAYSVSSPQVTLRNVHLQGVAPDMAENVRNELSLLVAHPYREGVGADANDQILAVYRDNGYLDAKLLNPQRSLITGADGGVDVDLNGTIEAGTPYRVKSITWPGTSLYSTSDFEKQNKLHPGDIASRKGLEYSTALIRSAYQHQGYMEVAVDPTPIRDTATHSVAYSFQAVPGAQYRVRSVQSLNLPPRQQQEFDRGWQMKAGDIYDADYIKTFLTKNTALRSFEGYNADFTTKADTETHLVDITIKFVRSGR